MGVHQGGLAATVLSRFTKQRLMTACKHFLWDWDEALATNRLINPAEGGRARGSGKKVKSADSNLNQGTIYGGGVEMGVYPNRRP